MNGNPQPPAVGLTANGPRPSAGASPAGLPSNTSTPQNAQNPQHAPPRRRRRPQAADPLRPVYRPLKVISRPMMSMAEMNQGPKAAAGSNAVTDGLTVEQARQALPSRGATTFPLVVTRRDLKELRHHVMRLQQPKDKGRADVLDESQFTPPIRLHRRDPRAPPSGAGSHYEEVDDEEDLVLKEEREKQELGREERKRIKAENEAQIAPSGQKKVAVFKSKTEQKFRPDDTPEAEKRRLLRYEETLPWHLEDFENRQTWVGTYESELSETHVMLTTDFVNNQDVIQLIPLERWYKFVTKSKIKVSTEDVDDPWLKSEGKQPKFLSTIEQNSIKKEREYAMRGKGAGRMRTRVGDKDEDGAAPGRGGDDDAPRIKREADADDIDFNLEEDFADDEEGLNGLFEGDEADIKDAAEKMKRDQLAAAAFDLRNEADIYRQEEQDRELAEQQKKLEKQLRKALTKREKNIDYEDSDSNPYESSSESENSDEEGEKKEEEKKEGELNGKPVEGDKLASGTSTKGTNTPSGVHKAVDINKKKRPGSPNLSEASGNESSVKRRKKIKDKSNRKTSLAHMSGAKGAGSGSDSEMTDAGKPPKQRIKVKMGGSQGGSPGGSRAGSPGASQLNGSRAGSPAAAPSPQLAMPSAAEIFQALPSGGSSIGALIAKFKRRIPKDGNGLFIKLVKAVASYDKDRQWITPLPQMPSDQHLAAILSRGKPAQPKSAAGSPS